MSDSSKLGVVAFVVAAAILGCQRSGSAQPTKPTPTVSATAEPAPNPSFATAGTAFDWAIDELRAAYPVPDDRTNQPAAERRFQAFNEKLKTAVQQRIDWKVQVAKIDQKGVWVDHISKPIPDDDLKVFVANALSPRPRGAKRPPSSFVLGIYCSRPSERSDQNVFPAPPPAVTDKLHKGSTVRITGVIDAFTFKAGVGATEHFVGGPATNGTRAYSFRATISAAKIVVDE